MVWGAESALTFSDDAQDWLLIPVIVPYMVNQIHDQCHLNQGEQYCWNEKRIFEIGSITLWLKILAKSCETEAKQRDEVGKIDKEKPAVNSWIFCKQGEQKDSF